MSTAPGVNNGCCAWVPWDGDYSTKFPANDGLGVNPQNQTTTAGYAQLSFKHDKWDGNVGVRFVKTEASGPASWSSAPAPSGRRRRPTTWRSPMAQSLETSDSNSYDNVLPSFNLRYKATDNFFLRFAVGKGIARPEFPQLLPSITIITAGGSAHGWRLRAACRAEATRGQLRRRLQRLLGQCRPRADGGDQLRPERRVVPQLDQLADAGAVRQGSVRASSRRRWATSCLTPTTA